MKRTVSLRPRATIISTALNAKGNYSRMLRDYEAIYRDYRLRQARFVDLREAAERDLKYMQEACADAQRQEQFVEKEQDELKADKKARTDEANAAHTHLAALEQKLAAIKNYVATMIDANLILAADIAKTQLEAAGASTIAHAPSPGEAAGRLPPAREQTEVPREWASTIATTIVKSPPVSPSAAHAPPSSPWCW